MGTASEWNAACPANRPVPVGDGDITAQPGKICRKSRGMSGKMRRQDCGECMEVTRDSIQRAETARYPVDSAECDDGSAFHFYCICDSLEFCSLRRDLPWAHSVGIICMCKAVQSYESIGFSLVQICRSHEHVAMAFQCSDHSGYGGRANRAERRGIHWSSS